MKKWMFLSLVLLLLVLSACSSEDVDDTSDKETMTDEVVKDGTEVIIDDGDLVVSDESEPDPEPEVEEFDASDLLVERDIKAYDYEETKTVSEKKLNGYTFEAFEAHYAYENTNAVVTVLYSGKNKVNLFDFLIKLDENKDFELLKAENFDYLEDDVYYDPYKNMYVWVSKGKVITVEYMIGTKLIERYLDENPASVIEGSYSDEQVVLEFKGEKNQKVIFLNDNQYLLELVDLDKSDNELTFSVNGEQKILGVSDEGIIGDLMIQVKKVDFSTQEVNIKILREVFEYKTLQINVGNTESFEMDGETYIIQPTAANSDSKDVVIELNSISSTFEVGEAKTLAGLQIIVRELFISDIGDVNAIVTLEIWKS
ncbi:hypothetical protein ACFLTH_16680 [Bacteroidota bacterium]